MRTLSQWLRDWLLEDTQRKVGQILESVSSLDGEVGELSHKIEQLTERIEQMAITFSDLVSKVEEVTVAEDAMVVAFQGLTQQLKDAPTEEAKQAIMDKLEAGKKKMLDAILVGTPEEPPVA